MMILDGPGEYALECFAQEPPGAFASVSGLGLVFVYRNGDLIDKVHLHGPTHTWWEVNPLFKPPLDVGEQIRIVLTGEATMRLEWTGLTRK